MREYSKPSPRRDISQVLPSSLLHPITVVSLGGNTDIPPYREVYTVHSTLNYFTYHRVLQYYTVLYCTLLAKERKTLAIYIITVQLAVQI